MLPRVISSRGSL